MGEELVKVETSGQYVAVVHQRAALDSTAWKAVLRSVLCQADLNIGVQKRRTVCQR